MKSWELALVDAETKYGVDSALLRSVIMVECRGAGFGSDGRLLIQFEPHWWVRMHNRQGRDQWSYRWKNGVCYVRDSKGKLILSNGVWNQSREWDAFNKALSIDEESAYLSTSYGMPQIMGFNHEKAGYKSAKEMYDRFIEGGEVEQIDAFLRFLRNTGLMEDLRSMNIARFAYRYNGPGYKMYNYDRRILKFYDKIKARES